SPGYRVRVVPGRDHRWRAPRRHPIDSAPRAPENRSAVMALDASLDRDELLTLIRNALDEDLRYGPDVTTVATVPADAVSKASVVSRQHGTVAGLDVGLLVLD